MLGDDESVGGKKFGGGEELEDAEIIVRLGVRWIEEDVGERGLSLAACGKSGQAAESVVGEDGYTAVDAQRFEVPANEGGRRCVIFDEDDFSGAAAERFNSDGSSASKDVEETRSFDLRPEDVEKRFAETIAGWAKG